MPSAGPQGQNIALLIDADNAPASRIDFIIAELASYGVVNIRRAYGNWKKTELIGWEKVLHEYAIRPMQHYDLIKGKNAADMALLIDAMDLLYTKNVSTFCLVSSDCDFTPLVQRLRDEGKQVIGFGSHRAPAPFVNSCTRFLYLDNEGAPADGDGVKEPATKRLKRDSKLINLLRSAVAAGEDDEGWTELGAVGAHITNQGSFDSRNYGFKKLSDLIGAIDLFEVRSTTNANGTCFWVRDKHRHRRVNTPAPIGGSRRKG
jgi:uncharacterized protein (TIGR00288 family)